MEVVMRALFLTIILTLSAPAFSAQPEMDAYLGVIGIGQIYFQEKPVFNRPNECKLEKSLVDYGGRLRPAAVIRYKIRPDMNEYINRGIFFLDYEHSMFTLNSETYYSHMNLRTMNCGDQQVSVLETLVLGDKMAMVIDAWECNAESFQMRWTCEL